MSSCHNAVLEAREARWNRIQNMCRPGLILFSCTARMPWELRQDAVFSSEVKELWQIFQEQLSMGLLNEEGQDIEILEAGWQISADGPEGWFLTSMSAYQAKLAAIRFENTPAGALLDIDVIDSGGVQVNRESLNMEPRPCLICGDAAKNCARIRRHSVQDISLRVRRLVICSLLGQLALDSLLEEASLPSKPGLVSPDSQGAHDDMDYTLLCKSAYALFAYFCSCVKSGLAAAEMGEMPALSSIRNLGIQTEQTMFRATGGVNTHKGAIFSFGVVCLCTGWLAASECHYDREELSILCAKVCKDLVKRELKGISSPRTASERLYKRWGVSGIRGEAEQGFPSVFGSALPIFQGEIALAKPRELAGMHTLLSLMSFVEDTNVLNRTGREGLDFVRRTCSDILSAGSIYTSRGQELFKIFCRECRARRISPGGCADLLALTLFLHNLDTVPTMSLSEGGMLL